MSIRSPELQTILKGKIIRALLFETLIHYHFLEPIDLNQYGGDSGYSNSNEGLVGFITPPATANTGGYKGARIDSGAGGAAPPNMFDKNPEFLVYIMLGSVTLQDAYILLGSANSAAPYAAQPQFGIHIANGALYTVSRDATTLSELDQSTTLSASTWYHIRVKLLSGKKIQTWVNRIPKTDKTNNLPSGTIGGNAGFHYVSRTGEAVIKRLFMRETKIVWDI